MVTKVLFYILIFIFGMFCAITKPLVDWTIANYGVSIREILYTIVSPMKGADIGFLKGALAASKNILYLFLFFFICFICVDNFIINNSKNIRKFMFKSRKISNAFLLRIYRLFILIIIIAGTFLSLKYVDYNLGITDFIRSYSQPTTIYEDYYIDPEKTKITAPDLKRNLIYIYLESMETTYMPKEVGGGQASNNYIPLLTDISNENISFSNTSKNGGWHTVSGTGWTMGALFSTTTGVPFSFPVNGNEMMTRRDTFASGITSLGDILSLEGYNQEFLCGSNAVFGGRYSYFKQHGDYQIFDYYSAIESGYIDSDYYVWWGIEDSILYDIAKDELTRLSDTNKPFNFTMLTVDTHHTGGYFCKKCESFYPDQLANILMCADKQIDDFINWCKKQPWYQNTTIIITGDHPRMDKLLVGDIDIYDRTVYNSFINVALNNVGFETHNREFTAMDMFPTILSSIGYQIEGDRLGLGTNLFSDKKTLCEQLSYKKLNSELEKYSKYYVKNFD